MLTTIINLLTGGVLNSLSGWKAYLQAKMSGDVQATDLAKAELLAEIEARKIAHATMLVEQGRWWTAAPRALVQWSLAIFVVKCVVWDTVLDWGTTSPLGGDIATWMGMIMVTWFGGRSLEKIAKVFRR